jgi:hypothetical protein
MHRLNTPEFFPEERAKPLNFIDSIGILSLILSLVVVVLTPPLWLKILLLIAPILGSYTFAVRSHWTHRWPLKYRYGLTTAASAVLLAVAIPQLMAQWKVSWYRQNWWPWLSRLASAYWTRAKVYLTSPSSIPHWVLLLIVSGLLMLVTLAVVVIVAVIRDGPAPQPSWRSYTTDMFLGLRWRWWNAEGTFHGLYPCCPRCDLRLRPDSVYRGGTVAFQCEDCGNVVQLSASYDEVIDQVTRFIDRNMRTGNFRPSGQTGTS